MIQELSLIDSSSSTQTTVQDWQTWIYGDEIIVFYLFYRLKWWHA